MIRIVVFIVVAACAFAQTLERPVRSVTDPGVITTRQNITPAGAGMIFLGRVYGVTFGASSAEIWALTNGAVFRLDWRENRVVERVAYEGAAGIQGIRFDPATEGVVISTARRSGSTGVRLFGVRNGAAREIASMDGQLAGALAVAPKPNAAGLRLAVAPSIAANQLAVVDMAGGGAPRIVGTGKAPFGAVISGDSSVAYVSNWGGRTPTADDLTAPTGHTPGSDRVVVDKNGIASTGAISRVDLKTGAVTHTIAVGLHPTAMAWDEAKARLYVTNGNDDSISVVDTAQQRVLRTIAVQPFVQSLYGIAPTALALSRDASTLYVACGGINAVAVVDTATGTVRGAIPTAWYPNGLALSPDGTHLAISTLLGAGSGWREEPRKRYVHANRGSVHVLPVPDAAQLASFTTSVAENNHLRVMGSRAAEPARTPLPVPARAGDPSLVEHVVYIIKENRTYDQVFGDIARGNGDPSLVMFGEKITPNQHRLAREFVLLDNFYATGGNSGDGHQWLTQANETDYCLWPGYFGRSYPFDGTDPIAYSKSGFIWDAALRMRKTVRVFGEYAGRFSDNNNNLRAGLLARWKAGEKLTAEFKTRAPLAPLNALLATNYPAYSTAVPDVVRARIFLEELRAWESAGRMPNLAIVQLPSDHTRGTAPGASTPAAMVADNDLALGQIVEGLSRSQFWKKMAIFVVEDDAQNGVDHVDGHRTVALAISPYVRRGAVDSTMYSHPSMLKTMELMLGLPSLTLFDLIANSMSASFTSQPDFGAYAAVVPEQSLVEVNPALAALKGEARRAARDSLKMRFEVPDAAPSERLNRILWHAAKGWDLRYPGVRRASFAPATVDVDDDER